MVAITTLGDICMQTPQDFMNYLDQIMEILLSAKDLALSVPEEDDLDDEQEYLEKLRLALLETFTSIGFGVQDIQDPMKLAKYVTQIFEFMKILSSNQYNPSIELIKVMLNLSADMINLYGHEMKNLIKQEFLSINLDKLKKVKSKKLESTIKWVEEVIISILK